MRLPGPRRGWPRALALIPLVVSMLPAAIRADGPPAAKLDFLRDVRPILSDKCFACHGPDAAERKAGLRLDTPEGPFTPAKSGSPAVVPGNAEQSELVFRITAEDDTIRMPPPNSGKSLTAEQAARLRAWVEQGAAYQVHWAFVPPRRPPVPEVSDPAWCRNPIDRFVLARLDREGLKPSSQADMHILIRRLHLDLIGLPPTLEAVDSLARAAEHDPQAALDQAVEQLLGSPHYGERWARVWLDAARYADSDGYEKDKARQVWAYRDWVINALNRDLPYDRFLIEQIAGDLLPNATQDQRVATGFLRNSMINEEGGVDPEQFRMEAMFDRMDAIGTGVLALTVRCAQCHSHKYDPITQEDYYRMFAFLNDCHEASIAVYSPEEQRQREAIAREIAALEEELKRNHPDWPERLQAWEAQMQAGLPAWEVVRPELDASGGQKHYLLEDGSVLAAGYAPTKHTTEFTARTGLERITAVRLELLNDPNLPLGGPGRSPKGLFALTEFRLVAAPAESPSRAQEVVIASATANVNPDEKPLEPMFDDKSNKRRVTGPISYAIDRNDLTAWTIDIGPGRSNVPRQAVFVLKQPIAFPKGAVLTFKLVQNHGGWNSDDNQNNNLGRFRFAVTGAPHAVADPLTPAVRAILAIPPEARTAEQSAAVFSAWRATVSSFESARAALEALPEGRRCDENVARALERWLEQTRDWREVNTRIEALWRQHPVGTSQLVLQARESPRPTHLLERGDFLKPKAPVQPGVPGFLNPLPTDAPRDRLTFARWLVDRQAPTTARAIVNRVWQAYFGVGLVATAEDFGAQGQAPSHPELLDWLAVEFMDGGWSLNRLHRLIVGSATYRQASRVTPELLARDPYNRLLARGPRFRVDGEVVRDIALAASGLLDPRVGGPSVFPPAPEFLFVPPASYGPKVWREARGPDRYRRALYTFRYRSVPYPALQTFDVPNGDFACARRSRSNTPLQALTTLNEPLFVEAARALALTTLADANATDEQRLARSFKRCLGRPPSARESAVLLDLLARQTSHFERPGAKPWDLAANDPEHPPALPPHTSPAQLAAWTAVSRVLLNLDETITKE